MSIHICFQPPWKDEKPEITAENMDEGYRVFVPYKFDFRDTLGKATCDCQLCIETYRPWIGVDWRHHPDCAIEKHIRRYPGIQNFVEWTGSIAHTE